MGADAVRLARPRQLGEPGERVLDRRDRDPDHADRHGCEKADRDAPNDPAVEPVVKPLLAGTSPAVLGPFQGDPAHGVPTAIATPASTISAIAKSSNSTVTM